jgi:hypothetical protein
MTKSMFLVAVAVTAMAVSAANAATVNVTIELNPAAPGCNGCTLSGPGTYNVFATASADDNQGIASYGISIQNVTTALHRSPRVTSSTDEEDNGGSAGFALFRSANNQIASGTGFLIGASQDTVAPTPHIINGFGQTASSFAAELPAGNTNIGIIQPTWSGKLLLAEGAYNVNGAAPFIDFSNIDVFANVFSGSGIVRAEIGGGTPVNLPPIVGDLGPLVGDQSANGPNVPTIVSGTLPAEDDGGVANLSWMFDGASTGPAAPLNAPSLDPATGLFSWDVNGQKGGLYTFPIKATDAGGLSDGGIMSVQVIVPEPATVCLIGLALVGFAGFRRK